MLQSKFSQPDSLSRESNIDNLPCSEAFQLKSPQKQPMIDYGAMEKEMKIDEIESPPYTGATSKKASIKMNRSMDVRNTEANVANQYSTESKP